MTDATDTGQHRAQTLDDRVVALESSDRAALVERIAALERAELGGGGFGSSRSSARGG